MTKYQPTSSNTNRAVLICRRKQTRSNIELTVQRSLSSQKKKKTCNIGNTLKDHDWMFACAGRWRFLLHVWTLNHPRPTLRAAPAPSHVSPIQLHRKLKCLVSLKLLKDKPATRRLWRSRFRFWLIERPAGRRPTALLFELVSNIEVVRSETQRPFTPVSPNSTVRRWKSTVRVEGEKRGKWAGFKG